MTEQQAAFCMQASPTIPVQPHSRAVSTSRYQENEHIAQTGTPPKSHRLQRQPTHSKPSFTACNCVMSVATHHMI